MKFWLDWETHKMVLSIFGALGCIVGFSVLLSVLPKLLATWLVLGVGVLLLYMWFYFCVKALD